MNKVKIFITVLSLFFILIFNAYPNDSPSFKSFFSDAVLVYGTQNKDTSRQEKNIADNIRKLMKSDIKIYQDTNIDESVLKTSNIILISADNSNSILNFTNLSYIKSNFPVSFKRGLFQFGNKYYSSKGESIVFIFPSPFNPQNYVLVYHSNSIEFLERITKSLKSMNENDYQVFGEKGKVIREGRFSKVNFGWKFEKNLDKDYEIRESTSKNLKNIESTTFIFNYYADSFASQKTDLIKKQTEALYKSLAKIAGVNTVKKINIYLFDSTPDKMNILLNLENSAQEDIYAVFNEKENEIPEEFSRYYFNQIINFSTNPAVENGFISYVKDFTSDNIDEKASDLYEKNKLPDLFRLLKGEINSPDSDIILGSFTKFLINRYGFENYKTIIAKTGSLGYSDELADISPEIYTSFSRIERDWMYMLSDLRK